MIDKDIPTPLTKELGATSAFTTDKDGLYDRVAGHLAIARRNVVRSVHTEMLTAYWNIGREIVEEEQKGSTRAEYGKLILKHLSEQLIADFGPGYGVSTLRDMRKFYLTYSDPNTPSRILHAVRDKLEIDPDCGLSWTHFRLLMTVKSPESRSFYEIEAIENCWSSRELERQVSSLLFERAL